MSTADIQRVWPAISALQQYAQRTGDIRLGADLLPIVLTVLTALREPSHDMTEPLVKPGDDRSAVVRVWRSMIDTLLGET